jgi:hypothetical protein
MNALMRMSQLSPFKKNDYVFHEFFFPFIPTVSFCI